jgi:hypothetical protein
MPTTRIAVTSVVDEGDQVVVRGVRSDGQEMAFAFVTKGANGDPELAARASRLSAGDVVDVDAVMVIEEWHVGRGITPR